ncbi:DsbA family protein [Shimia thalassica]|jgi:protein-disulfide isomerase|uniref:DsbA family protein n=1 Tax=Shimia thalassica TaxID=1715693 RepID=UPI001C09DAC9|nr:DsbA family protein [Shimia thalassica]MBU2941137.1 DsbA family protein [Shimia thalassica]MDO6503379.1 DsbA family protein [Shimia thalassica]
MNRIIPIAIVAVIAAAGAGFWFSQSNGEAHAEQTQIQSSGSSSDDAAMADTSGVIEMVMGSEDAPVTIIEYASFTCPHCATFHEGVLKPLKADYVETGKVKFIFRDVYFDRFGLWASMVARCAGPEKFFGMADLLMKGQSEWTRAGDPVAIAGELRKVGRLAGIEDEKLQACMQDEDKAKSLVAWYEKNVAKDDISGTPTLIIDGEKHSNMSYADLKKLIDDKLAQ